MFHRQPLKFLYLSFFILKTILKLPIWIFKAIIPPFSTSTKPWSLKKTLNYNITRDMMKIIPKVQLGILPSNVEVPDGTFENCMFVWVTAEKMDDIKEPVRSFAQRSGVQSDSISGFWYFKEGHCPSRIEKPSPEEKVIFCVHGGAFIHGSAHPSDIFPRIPKKILRYTDSVTRAFSIDYRLSSTAPFEDKNPFPAALIDVIAGYRYILSLGFLPRNVIILGDSAGANLAFALVRYIKETKPVGLFMPGRLILFSPWTDITHSRDEPGSSIRTNDKCDVLNISSEYITYGQRAYLGKTWTFNEARLNPYIACTSLDIEPKKGEYLNYPKTLVIAGEREWNRDDAIRTYDYLKADNPQPEHVTLYIIPNEVHDILLFNFADRQRTEALLNIVRWIDG